MQILALEQFSFTKKVDYAKMVAELYDAEVSDDPQQDVYVTKLVANVTVALLISVLIRNRLASLFRITRSVSTISSQRSTIPGRL